MHSERRPLLVASVGLALALVLSVVLAVAMVFGLHGAELIHPAIDFLTVQVSRVEVMLDGISLFIRR